jgi:hypothetical protein
MLVNLDDVKDRAVGIGVLQVIDNFADGRPRTAEIETRVGVQRVRPRRSEESHDPTICREAVLAEQCTESPCTSRIGAASNAMLCVVISKMACSNSKPSPSAPGRCRRIENRPLQELANGSITPKTEPGTVAATRATFWPMQFPSLDFSNYVGASGL